MLSPDSLPLESQEHQVDCVSEAQIALKISCLKTIGELTQTHGVDTVERWMQSIGLFQLKPDFSLNRKDDLNISLVSGIDMISDVEALGVKMTPDIIALVANSTVKQVKIAIANYKTTKPYKSAEDLFYTILKNVHKSSQ
ncbi:hypothetical protein CAL7102_00548 [Dulcicalothrix desertica PCC 7102]|nr:hypothetical protein CAL7102_00548 [Dulcicalothrix desertica PCC 7102]